MTARNLAARLVFMAVICAGLVFSAETQRVEAQCTTQVGSACQTACPAGWSTANSFCASQWSSIYVNSVQCDPCHFPGRLSGVCSNFDYFEPSCY